MLRSIRAEWYKAVRRPYFPILFLTCTLLTVGAVYCLYLIKTQSPGITPIGLPFALSLSPLGMVMGLWLVAIGGDLVFSEQYKHHTLKNEVSFGIPRARIYLSRWAAVFLVMLLLYAVLVAVCPPCSCWGWTGTPPISLPPAASCCWAICPWLPSPSGPAACP